MQRLYRGALIIAMLIVSAAPTLAQETTATAAATPPAGMALGLLLVGMGALAIIGFVTGSSESADNNGEDNQP